MDIKSTDRWTRKPFTRKEMYEMFEINQLEHSEDEIRLRVKAAQYPSCRGAYITVGEQKFYLEYENRKPVVE